MDLSSIPSFLHPRLRLFFGVDLVGSTSFKQKGDYPLKPPVEAEFKNLGARWFSGIANFYRDIEQQFSTAWADCRAAYQEAVGSELSVAPKLWKTNGDELIYEASLNEPEDVAYVLAAWISALKSYRGSLRAQNKDLDVKATAWIAGFPIGNAEVVFCQDVSANVKRYEDEDPKIFHFSQLERWYANSLDLHLIKDFVGPAVDTGFRLSAYSTPRKFAISLEIALILSLAPPPNKFCQIYRFDPEYFRIAFEGLYSLKGVFGGKPYPVFWLDIMHNDTLTRAFNDVSPTNKPEQQRLITFIQRFIEDNEEYIFSPFIANCGNQHFRALPQNYESSLQKLASRWMEEKDRLQIRWQSVVADSHPNDASAQIVDRVEDTLAEQIFNQAASSIPK